MIRRIALALVILYCAAALPISALGEEWLGDSVVVACDIPEPVLQESVAIADFAGEIGPVETGAEEIELALGDALAPETSDPGSFAEESVEAEVVEDYGPLDGGNGEILDDAGDGEDEAYTEDPELNLEEDIFDFSEEEAWEADVADQEAEPEPMLEAVDDELAELTRMVAPIAGDRPLRSGDALDNGALFEDYVRRMLEKGDRWASVDDHDAGSQLSARSRLLYEAMHILVEQVAAGERASTCFEIPAATLGLEGVLWTTADLGVSRLVDEGNTVTDEAGDAMFAVAGLDVAAVMRALLSDCPYALYWFNKAMEAGGGWSAGYGLAYGWPEGELAIGFDSVKLVLCVAPDYAGADNVTFNVEIPASVRRASERIGTIVRAHAGEDDAARLESYRREICELTRYNPSAMDNISALTDINPWQLIWVFDGDPDTNVVCEGYAKAFKYLCDRSEFRGGVNCILATGTLRGVRGAGLHMWNVVTMPDGRNYLADITNSDDGAPGAGGALFLTGGAQVGEGSYAVECPGGAVTYTYDNDTLNRCNRGWLRLAEQRYAPGATFAPATAPKPASAGEQEAASAAKPAPKPAPEPAKVEITGAKRVLKAGRSLQLSAVSAPEASGGCTWRSSDRSVATVSRSGKVVARKPGSVQITVTAASGASVAITISIRK